MLGQWTDVGKCDAHGCNKGIQFQQRGCVDGANEICHKKELSRLVRCTMTPTMWNLRNCTENWDCRK